MGNLIDSQLLQSVISYPRVTPMLFARALLAFLVLPGMAAVVLPWWIASTEDGRGPGWPVLGSIVVLLGAIILLQCVRDFYVSGRGTLAPWDPPRRLVVVGLYRFTRNPMYVGVLTLVLGWSMLFGSLRLAAYLAVLAVAFHLRTVLYEEPRLAESFGADFARYRATVPRWLPRWPGANGPA